MNYNVTILRRAQKQLADLPSDIYPKVKSALREFSQDPRPVGCIKLRDREGWRIRVGDYRVIYAIDDSQKTVTILHIGHRRDIYR